MCPSMELKRGRGKDLDVKGEVDRVLAGLKSNDDFTASTVSA